jgi:Ca2+:H+ antiporter
VSRAYYLAVFIPIAIALNLADASATAIFFTAALGIVPTAVLMSDATEHLAARAGPGIGSLLNVTFGNAPELIIAFVALTEGLQEVVKASLVGSVIGNSLLVLGAAMVVGGVKHGRQRFSRAAIERLAGLLLLSVVAMAIPALVQIATGDDALPGVDVKRVNYGSGAELLSLVIAIGLGGAYVIFLARSVRNRSGIFSAPAEKLDEAHDTWSVRRSVVLLALAGVLVGVMSEVLVGSIEEASHSVGLSPFFVGVFVVGIAGNAAEHWVAVVFAAKNKMDLAMNIAVGSSVQIAMFLVPALVLLSFPFGPEPMALVFNGYEVVALVLTGIVSVLVVRGGESTRNEGGLLLGLYVTLGVVFALA